MRIILYMLLLLLGGISAFSASFTLSYSITREILKYQLERYYIQIKQSQSKVRFKPVISVRSIPHRRNLSSDTLNKLWYSNIDYEYFNNCYLKEKSKVIHNTI